MAQGAFQLENEGEGFNLKPKDDAEVPDDQAAVSVGVYAVIGGMKTLKDHGAFGPRDAAGELTKAAEKRLYAEFVDRVMQVAKAGCVAQVAHTRLAEGALGQIRTEIVARKGRWLVNRYLVDLAFRAVGGMALGGVLWPLGYPGWAALIAGSMAGVWLSAASRRRDVAFEGVGEYLDRGLEPLIRVAFVAITSIAFALFLELKMLQLTVGKVDLASFGSDVRVALALGLVAGFGERVIPERVMTAATGADGH